MAIFVFSEFHIPLYSLGWTGWREHVVMLVVGCCDALVGVAVHDVLTLINDFIINFIPFFSLIFQ